jgi:hypothetical protein
MMCQLALFSCNGKAKLIEVVLFMRRGVTCQVPDEAIELASDRNADFGGLHLPTQAELAIALSKAQLRVPGDIADGFGLTLLADLVFATDVGGIAIRPGRLDQYASCMPVARAGDRALTTGLPLECSEGTRPR